MHDGTLATVMPAFKLAYSVGLLADSPERSRNFIRTWVCCLIAGLKRLRWPGAERLPGFPKTRKKAFVYPNLKKEAAPGLRRMTTEVSWPWEDP